MLDPSIIYAFRLQHVPLLPSYPQARSKCSLKVRLTVPGDYEASTHDSFSRQHNNQLLYFHKQITTGGVSSLPVGMQRLVIFSVATGLFHVLLTCRTVAGDTFIHLNLTQ